jgi:hypothetical protein
MKCTKADLQAFIRSNGVAWPGGYPTALLMADGECIDAQAARENYRALRYAGEPQWTPVGVIVHWEGPALECAHSGRLIDSAYGIPDD